ncbi:MAG: hypothetical protein U0Y68_20820 [Blastocatellia bacterium]
MTITASNKPEVVNSLTNDLDLLQKEFYKWCDILMAGDGSGCVGTLGSGSSTTVLNLDTIPAGVHAKAFGVDILKKNVPYDIYNGTTLSTANVTISSIDYANNQATLVRAGRQPLWPEAVSGFVEGLVPERHSLRRDGAKGFLAGRKLRQPDRRPTPSCRTRTAN